MKVFLNGLKNKSHAFIYLSVLAILICAGYTSYAQEEAGATVADAVFVANNVWMLVATFLVFRIILSSITTNVTCT